MCRKVQSSTLSFMSSILPLLSVSSFLVLVRHSTLFFEVNQLGITTMGVKDLVATRKSAHIEDSAHIFFWWHTIEGYFQDNWIWPRLRAQWS